LKIFQALCTQYQSRLMTPAFQTSLKHL